MPEHRDFFGVQSRILKEKHFLLRGLICNSAVGAQAAEKALGSDSDETRAEQERIDTHIKQARYRARCIVTVQRAYHQVTG